LADRIESKSNQLLAIQQNILRKKQGGKKNRLSLVRAKKNDFPKNAKGEKEVKSCDPCTLI